MRSYRKFLGLTAILNAVWLLSYPIPLLGCTGTCEDNCGCSSHMQVSAETKLHTETSPGFWTNRETQKKEILEATAQSLGDKKSSPCNDGCSRVKVSPSDFILPNNSSFSQTNVHSRAILNSLSIHLQIPSPTNPLQFSISLSEKSPPHQLFLTNAVLLI